MTAVIIDDEKAARETLVNLVGQYCPALHIAGQASSGEEGLHLIQALKPDIVFLDIEMPGLNGFEVLQRLERMEFALIFVTAFNAYAERAFEFSALDFLPKPVDPMRLLRAVHKAGERQQQRTALGQYHLLLELIGMQGLPPALDHRIVFSTQTEIVFSWLRHIVHIRADGNSCWVKLFDQPKPLFIVKNIGEYERLFAPYAFLMRVHRSHLVNLVHVRKFLREECSLLLVEKEKVPVTPGKREDLLHRLHALGDSA
jgi:two-component system LytT family response regulator